MRIVIAMLVSVFVAAPVWALNNAFYFKVLGNQTLSKINFGGNEDKDGNFGPGIGIEYERRITPHFAMGFEYDWVNRSERESSIILPRSMTTISGNTHAFLVNSKWRVLPDSKVCPFLSLGLGLGQTQLKMESIPNPGFVWTATGTRDKRTLVDSAQTSVAWALRTGFDAKITDRVMLGLGVGFLGTGSATHPAADPGRQVLGDFSLVGSQANFTVGVQMGYMF